MENFKTVSREYTVDWGVNTEQINMIGMGLKRATVLWTGGGGYRVITLSWAQSGLLDV